MEKRHKDILRPLVAGLRRLLAGTADGTQRGDLDRELERLGISPDGGITLHDALPTFSYADHVARQVAEAELQQIADLKARTAARAAFIERAAYGWINRLLALRVLEARGLIDETLRANPAYDDLPEALYLLRQGEPGRAAGPDGGWWAVIEDACAAQAAALPGLFSLDTAPNVGEGRRADDTLRDPAIALRPSTSALLDCVALLGDAPAGTPQGRVEEVRAAMDAAFTDPDAIGWAYQFYQEEAKAQVYVRLKAGKKVTTRDEIAAATQLFTEPYMVKWLLQNSLGRSYHEAYPHSVLPDKWEYHIQPERLDPPAFATLAKLTVLDPCMGSGHFLRETFDMLVVMYREQHPELSATEIADRILGEHLHGVDIDPRAAGLAAFTLYARAWELVRDERRIKRQAGAGNYRPAAMNLATTPDRIAPGALARHLQRHPEDRMLEPLLKGVFAALEQADTLGSLLRPREHLQAAVSELRKVHQLRLGTPEEMDLQSAIEAVAQSDPAHLEEMLLDRVAAGFAVEARGAGDVAAQLFGRAAERGVRLLQLLDRQYAVVVTNPPYMGSGNMDAAMLRYVERHYAPGKRDLYAAFILCCLSLAGPGGRVAMVTQQSWMFLASFAALRALPEAELGAMQRNGVFRGLLRETSLEVLAHLGPNSFEEISGEVVQSALFVTSRCIPVQGHQVTALRLIGLREPEAKRAQLLRAAAGQPLGILTRQVQANFLPIPDSPLVYWLRPRFFALMSKYPRLGSTCAFAEPLTSGDSGRFVRFNWESTPLNMWKPQAKGGGYRKWFGFQHWSFRWDCEGAALKSFPGSYIRNEEWMFQSGVTYSEAAGGKLSARILISGEAFGKAGPGILCDGTTALLTLSVMNARVSSYLIRISARGLLVSLGAISALPNPIPLRGTGTAATLVRACIALKSFLVAGNLLERIYAPESATTMPDVTSAVAAMLHSLEGLNERLVCDAYGLNEDDVASVLAETGVPVGWHPTFNGYDAMPPLPTDLTLPDEVLTLLERHLKTTVARLQSTDHLTQIKIRLRTLYEAGPGNSVADEAGSEDSDGRESDTVVEVAGAYLPIPAETFLEELSQKLQIHPISVYSLLREIRAEGARCKSEERHLLEDRLSVLVLRLFGHRWPKQLEAGEPLPEWADRDGIIPLSPGAGERTLAERLRERLRADDGDLGAQQVEVLLSDLTGQDLETWLRRDFFPRHVRQFKYRPIVWHLASTPQLAMGKEKVARGKGGARQTPVFECLVYLHTCGVGMLANIRTQYLEPLLRTERGREDTARKAGDDTTAAQAHARVAELEAFAGRLRQVEEEGFACTELNAALADDPLDRWSGDGILAPASRDELLSHECAWVVDINDGVRVNIAPLQLAGVLAADVLKAPDARKAIADRARWRADERHWVREGVLPRCGWMVEVIPESRRWTDRAPERLAAAEKLARKRAEALAKLEARGE